jgi:hypothetical protein
LNQKLANYDGRVLSAKLSCFSKSSACWAETAAALFWALQTARLATGRMKNCRQRKAHVVFPEWVGLAE